MAEQRHAVVVGGSMAGLLAARVLAERVDWVSVIERDAVPDAAEPRKGVAQGRHAHGLLTAGERVLGELFPGLLDDLVARGAPRVRSGDGRWWQCGGLRVAADEAPGATFVSRPFLEHAVRERVRALRNVAFVDGAARALVTDEPGGAVRGVDVEDPKGRTWTVLADLVVDASGRGSQAARWLEQLGYAPPPTDRVRVDMAYATRLYTRTPGRLPDRTWYVTISDPPDGKRFGVAFPIEGDRWIVTLAGCHGDHPPTDDTGHLAFARTLPTGDIAELLEHEQPLGPVVPHRMGSSQWRRFDRLERHPAGFLAIGDAICSFNPIYGQGMSSAAQQATVLASCIDDIGIGAPRLWARFYAQAKKVIANPWSISAGGDFAFRETTGPKPPGADVVNRYVRRVVVAAQRDPAVATALWNVQGLLAPPPSLLRPATLVRVLWGSRRGPVGAPVASERGVAELVGNRAV